jgi:hypothetical protein
MNTGPIEGFLSSKHFKRLFTDTRILTNAGIPAVSVSLNGVVW